MTQPNSIQPTSGNAASAPSGYRLQIDGIRALAVLLVIVGHYAPTKARFTPGGGIGVRVFFVISGFLITGILLSLSLIHI